MADRRERLRDALLGAPWDGMQRGQATGTLRNAPPMSLREKIMDLIVGGGRAAGFSATQANRMRNDAGAAVDFVPGVGDAIGIDETKRAFSDGRYGDAALNGATTAIGAVPGAGDLAAGAIKAIFGGVGAKTANRAALQTAEEMLAKGADKRSIWDATGWFKGADDKWRFEIDDSASKLTPKAADELMAGGGGTYGATQRTAPGVLQHSALYEAYPELRSIDVDARQNANLGMTSVNGEYIGYGLPGNGNRPSIKVQGNSLEGSPDSVRGLMLHELQHPVQDLEGFASGSSLAGFKQEDMWREARSAYEASADDNALLRELGVDAPDIEMKPWDGLSQREQVKWLERGRERLYYRQAGEVEARNAQTRMNMPPEQRRAKPPWETQDVPHDQQIVRFRR